MRWAFTDVPLWQMVLSWCLLVVSALLSIWAAARIFRAGMLRYGQALDLRGLADILRPTTGAETQRDLPRDGVSRRQGRV
jgi:hypothetical protein